MTAQPSVSISWVNTLVSAAERQGVSLDALLETSGLKSDRLREPRIGVDEITRLWRAAGELTADPGFGLKAGKLVGPASFNIVSYILMSSATLRDAIGILQQFQRLISDGGRFQLIGGEDHSWLVYHPQQGELAFSHHQIEAVLTSVLFFSRWVTGRDQPPEQVQFTHAAQSPLADYQYIFGCDVQFGGAFNGILLSNHHWDMPLPQADAQLANLHREYAAAQLAELSSDSSFIPRLKSWLRNEIPKGVPERHQAARQVGLADRSFAHRLHTLGLHYAGVVEEVRHEQALLLLRDLRLPISVIAQQLGFSEPSAFNRAFRRWEGITPGTYRKQAGLS